MNAKPFCKQPADRFKVWPTDRDRPSFNAVMAATPPVDYDAVGFADERMVQAHRFFSEQAREWLSSEGTEQIGARADAIETVVRDLLQMVVIDLNADENAQEIFETLNARGAQLTAADLIKTSSSRDSWSLELKLKTLTSVIGEILSLPSGRKKSVSVGFSTPGPQSF